MSHATGGENPLLLTSELVPYTSPSRETATEEIGDLMVIPRDLEEEILLCAPWDDAPPGRTPRKCLSGDQCVGLDPRVPKEPGCEGFCLVELMSREEIRSLRYGMKPSYEGFAFIRNSTLHCVRFAGLNPQDHRIEASPQSPREHGIYPSTRRMCVLCTRRLVTDAYIRSIRGEAGVPRNTILNNYCNIVSAGSTQTLEAYPRFMCIPFCGNLQVQSPHLIHSSCHVASKFPKTTGDDEARGNTSGVKRKRGGNGEQASGEEQDAEASRSSVWHGVVGQIRCFSFHDLCVREPLRYEGVAFVRKCPCHARAMLS